MITKEEIIKGLGNGKYSCEQLANTNSCIFHTLVTDKVAVFISEFSSGDLYGTISVSKGKKEKRYAGFESDKSDEFLKQLKDKIQTL